MIPIIYDSSVSSTVFTSNGKGWLSDAIECTIEEEINGIYQLHLVYPVNGIHASDLKTMNIIKAVPAYGKTAQPFDIFRVSMSRYDRIEVDARHVSYRLNKHTVKPFGGTFSLPSNLFSAITSNSAEVYYFTYESNITRACNVVVDEPTSIRKALSMVTVTEQDGTVYSPEFEWDNFNVIMSKQRGTTRYTVIKYGKNLVDYKQEQNIEETVTGFVPFWHGKDASGNEVVVTGGAVLATNASSFPYKRTVPLDLSSEFKEKPTTTQLNQKARTYIDTENVGVPKVSLDVFFIILSQTLEYQDLTALYTVNLGDTITVEYEKLGVSAQARVTRTVYDVLKDRYKEISLGDAKIRGQSAQSAVAPVKKQVSQISNAVTALEASSTTTYASGTPGTATVIQEANQKRCKLVKTGKSVRCYMGVGYADGTTAIPANTTLFTIPAGYRPKTDQVFPGTGFRSVGKTVSPALTFNTNGTITHNAGSDITMLVCSAEWEVS